MTDLEDRITDHLHQRAAAVAVDDRLAEVLVAGSSGPSVVLGLSAEREHPRTAWRYVAAASVIALVVGSLAAVSASREPTRDVAQVPPIDAPAADRAIEVRVVERGEAGLLRIDRGRVDGLRVGMPVIDSGGLVGKVDSVTETSSTVVLVTDARFEAVVSMSSDAAVNCCIIRGSSGGQVLAERVPPGAGAPSSVEPDDGDGGSVVWTTVTESTGAPGIPVGRIDRVPTVDARSPVTLFADLDRLDGLRVLQYRLAAPAPVPSSVPEVEPGTDRVSVPPTSTAQEFPTRIARAERVAIGASVMLGAAEELSGMGFLVDAEESRSTNSLFAVVAELVRRGAPSEALVIEVGTNGPIDADGLDEALRLVGDIPSVVLVNGSADRSWTAPNNDLLTRRAADHPNVVVADWAAEVEGCETCLYQDGFHLRVAGAERYAELIDRAVEAMQPPLVDE